MGIQKKLEACQVFKRIHYFFKAIQNKNEITEKDKKKLIILTSPEYSAFKDRPLTKNSFYFSELKLQQIESLTNIERCNIKFSIKK